MDCSEYKIKIIKEIEKIIAINQAKAKNQIEMLKKLEQATNKEDLVLCVTEFRDKLNEYTSAAVNMNSSKNIYEYLNEYEECINSMLE